MWAPNVAAFLCSVGIVQDKFGCAGDRWLRSDLAEKTKVVLYYQIVTPLHNFPFLLLGHNGKSV
jgi:hypothetical protein